MSAGGELGTSRRYIDQQYGDDRNLAARYAIYHYQQPRLDLHNDALDLAQLQGDESILDIGCGNGRYLEVLHAREHRGFLSDAQALPFATDAFDIVLAEFERRVRTAIETDGAFRVVTAGACFVCR